VIGEPLSYGAFQSIVTSAPLITDVGASTATGLVAHSIVIAALVGL
jgi:hypothetical protein